MGEKPESQTARLQYIACVAVLAIYVVTNVFYTALLSLTHVLLVLTPVDNIAKPIKMHLKPMLQVKFQ